MRVESCRTVRQRREAHFNVSKSKDRQDKETAKEKSEEEKKEEERGD